jgi:heme exporter protein A
MSQSSCFASRPISYYVAQMMGQGQSCGLKLSDVGSVRGGRTLFAGLSLTLVPGDAALVTGPNGIGKSSLLRTIAGLLPAQGKIERTGRLALADENCALDPELPLAQALAFWARLDAGDETRVNDALAALGINHLGGIPVRILSTGQRKRAVLARTIASAADIWLLDEPTNGLDATAIPLLEAAIAAHRSGGGIIVAATHQGLAMPGALSVGLA